MSLNIAHIFELAAKDHADKVAVILDDYRMTYHELLTASRKVAGALEVMGVQRGDKVAIMIPNTPHFPTIYYGILALGATVVPVNVLLKGSEISYYLEDSDSVVFFAFESFYDEAVKGFERAENCGRLVVVEAGREAKEFAKGGSFLRLLDEARPAGDTVATMPDDTAVILYTSGTTGRPKGAELTHFNVFFNAYISRAKVVHSETDDVSLAVLPLFHSFGQVAVMNVNLLFGSTITLVPKFDAEKVLDVIQRDKVSVIAMVPSMYYWLLNFERTAEYDLSSLRMAVSGGAALPVEVLKEFKERFGIGILEGYGLSETSPVASFNVLERPSKPGSIGVPIWGVDMRIKRDDGAIAEEHEVGEIIIRGHNIMKGYYKKPEATAEAIVDGWFHSGDMAYRDEDGYYFIVDRKKDMIIRSGMNIYPREIEEVLYGHPAILEVAVIGAPDPARGEEVKACVAFRQGASATPEELDLYCQERLAKYKCPRIFEVLPELPKGPTGKVLKRELREAARAQMQPKMSAQG